MHKHRKLILTFGPPTGPRLSHGRDLSEVLRAAFRCDFSAKFAQYGSGFNGKQMIGEHNGIAQQFSSALRAALGKFGRGIEQGLGFRDHVAERFQILALWHRLSVT